MTKEAARADLAEALKVERLAAYARLGGGWPIPLAGGLWWSALAALGGAVSHHLWSLAAFVASGLLFPLALGIAKLARVDFMRDRTAVTSVLFPTFVSMLLFWPIAIATFWEANTLTPLVLAVGMSIHWPVIGWSYGRPGPYIGHAIVRAVACFLAWKLFPEARFMLVPAVVAAAYFATVLVLIVDSGGVRRRLNSHAPAV